jgi:GGDEF domain-containing protein
MKRNFPVDKFLGLAAKPMLISIKKFLDHGGGAALPQPDLLEALRQMGRLLLDGIGTHAVRGREADLALLRRTMQSLVRHVGESRDALGPLSIASEAIDALETYSQATSAYHGEADQQMRSMLAMLADTVTDLSDQTDSSVARLQGIERQILRASELEDTRVLRTHLESCLAALREAAAHQRSSSAATLERLQHHIGKSRQRDTEKPRDWDSGDTGTDLVPEPLDDAAPTAANSYVAAFKLQRAEHIASRFGEDARHRMLSLIGTRLKGALGPQDRLLRWKGQSFVMFLSTVEALGEVRSRLSEIVAAAGQQYIEVGRKSALLSVGVDWILFPQAQCPTLETVFTELDAFLANAGPGHPAAMGRTK